MRSRRRQASNYWTDRGKETLGMTMDKDDPRKGEADPLRDGDRAAAQGERESPESKDADERAVDRERALAAVRPTTSAPTSPGRVATATAPRSASDTPATRRASSIMGKTWRTCSREAISGTTPPKR